MSYAHYLIHDEGKWEEFAGTGDGLNSHMPTLETYRRMLAVWRQCVAERHLRDIVSDSLLTTDELKRTAAARIHPRNRGDSSS